MCKGNGNNQTTKNDRVEKEERMLSVAQEVQALLKEIQL
jgi:hypothetical protein